MNFYECPRCGWESLEKLRTYSYCINCNYNTVEDTHLKPRKRKRSQRKEEQEEVQIDVAQIKAIQDQMLEEENKE